MSTGPRPFLLGCLILLSVSGITALITAWMDLNRAETFYIGLGLSFLGILSFVFVDSLIKSEKHRATVLYKIAEMQEKKFPLHSERVQKLSGKDISSLKIYKIIVISIVSSVGVIAVLMIAIMSISDNMKLVISGLVFLIFLVIGLGINERMNRTIFNGVKTVVRGIVTKKDTSLGEAKDKPHHWLYLGDRKIKVENIIYVTYHIGNAAEFHLFDYFGTVVLHHKKLENAGIEGE